MQSRKIGYDVRMSVLSRLPQRRLHSLPGKYSVRSDNAFQSALRKQKEVEEITSQLIQFYSFFSVPQTIAQKVLHWRAHIDCSDQEQCRAEIASAAVF